MLLYKRCWRDLEIAINGKKSNIHFAGVIGSIAKRIKILHDLPKTAENNATYSKKNRKKFTGNLGDVARF
jgi:hypothetical protein